MSKSKTRGTFMTAAWLIIVCVSLAYGVINFRNNPAWSAGAVIIGISMLVIFFVDHVFKGKLPGKDVVGDYAVLVMVFGGLIVLAGAFLTALITGSWQPAIITGIFLAVFSNIVRDYVKHLKRKAKKLKDAEKAGGK